MNDQRDSSELPSVLKSLGSMTAIRDTLLVEQSLLRTLGPMLGVLSSSLYRVTASGVVWHALHHSKKVVVVKGTRSVEDNIREETFHENQQDTLSGDLLDLFESVKMLGKTCSRRIDADLQICFPITGMGDQLGYFVFQRDREVTPTEHAIVDGVLEVFTNYHELLDTSQRDQLTGLLNRYSLESSLDRLWNLLVTRLQNEEAKGVRRPEIESYWVCVLDIDYFKRINDTFGHVIGDEVLVIVSQLLKNVIRESDLIYRYGGEEFVVVIAAKDIEAASILFERVRATIESFHFPQVGKITLSGGYSEADPTVLPKESLNRADQALYAAKEAGRNRIYNYEQLLETKVLQKPQTGTVDLF